jgi:hypothetical protein
MGYLLYFLRKKAVFLDSFIPSMTITIFFAGTSFTLL